MTPIETAEMTIPAPFLFTREQYDQVCEWGWFGGYKVELLDGVVWNQNGKEGLAPWQWSQEEYYKILDAGWFIEHRVELIDGEILEMPAQKNLHAMGISLADFALRAVFGPNYWVRVQASLDLRPRSTPDPDIAVVHGGIRSHNKNANPTRALLIVEVSHTTLAYDRGWKASLYASCGIADYWILNVLDQQLEVYRSPVADASKRFGFRYGDRTDLTAGAFISPLAAPTASIAVADLLP